MDTMLKIRTAKMKEYDSVQAFYDHLIDHLYLFEYGPLWQKNVYPSYAYLKESIQKEELYIGIYNQKIVSAMIVNRQGNDSYKNSRWLLDTENYLVIHALGVNPYYKKLGFGKQMIRYIQNTREEVNSIRLDVLKGNVSARALYESMGFVQTDTISMYYEDTGWKEFEMYEYIMK